MSSPDQSVFTRKALRDYYQTSTRYRDSLLAHDELMLQQYVDLISKYVPASESILDLGCGTGLSTQLLCHEGLNAVGADISALFLNVGKSQWDTDLACTDAFQLPFRDRTFSAVAAFEFIEHVPDVPTLLKEIDRVLRPGGYIVFNSPNLVSPYTPLLSLKQMLVGKNGTTAFGHTVPEVLWWFGCNLFLSAQKSFSSNPNFIYRQPDLSENKVGGDTDSAYLANQKDLQEYLERLGYTIRQLAWGKSLVNRMTVKLTPTWAPWMAFVAQKPLHVSPFS